MLAHYLTALQLVEAADVPLEMILAKDDLRQLNEQIKKTTSTLSELTVPLYRKVIIYLFIDFLLICYFAIRFMQHFLVFELVHSKLSWRQFVHVH